MKDIEFVYCIMCRLKDSHSTEWQLFLVYKDQEKANEKCEFFKKHNPFNSYKVVERVLL